MFNKTVDSVLKTVNQAIADLDNIAKQENRKAETLYFKANELEEKGRAHDDEGDRAAVAADRLRGLEEEG